MDRKTRLMNLNWNCKDFKAVWRGTSTGGFVNSRNIDLSKFHRQRLVNFCLDKPLCDAKFSEYNTCVEGGCELM
jgi:hypothetical protein